MSNINPRKMHRSLLGTKYHSLGFPLAKEILADLKFERKFECNLNSTNKLKNCATCGCCIFSKNNK